MRNFILLSALAIGALIFSACASSEQQKVSTGGAEAMPTATVRTSSPIATAPTNTGAPPTAIAHGAQPLPENGAPQPGTQSGAQSSGAGTTAFDKKVEQAEAKAKAPKATQADKQAAAAAYLERGNFFYNAGNPMLYKFALRDFRRTLRYDPNNEEARTKRDTIVDIYTNSLHRPVPELGNEP